MEAAILRSDLQFSNSILILSQHIPKFTRNIHYHIYSCISTPNTSCIKIILTLHVCSSGCVTAIQSFESPTQTRKNGFRTSRYESMARKQDEYVKKCMDDPDLVDYRTIYGMVFLKNILCLEASDSTRGVEYVKNCLDNPHFLDLFVGMDGKGP